MKHATVWLLATVMLGDPAVAEDVIDEITVSADLRGRPLSELAASVTVLDENRIDVLADQHFEELLGSIPNLNWSGDGHRARYFQIRGVGELEQYQGAPNPSIGFLVDDIDFSGIGTIATLFDIDRVEILRGPQGSRYGANALGGLIYLQSVAPSADSDGKAEISLGDDDTFSAAAAFGGALTDNLSFRLSGQGYASNGFRDNSTLGRDDTNSREESTARLRLRWQLADGLEANATLLFADIDNGYDAFAIDNSYTMLSDKPGSDAQQSLGLALKLEWSGWRLAELTSITTVADSDIDFSFDADWGSDASWSPFVYDYTSASIRQRKTASQEFRLASNEGIFGGRVDWLVGVYALRLDDELLSLNEGSYFDPFFNFSDSLFDRFDSDYSSTNVALFGQLDVELDTRTRLSAGLRVERRTTDYDDSQGVSASPSETMTGGELSISRDLSDAASAYATLSAGFRAGGFNLGLLPDALREFGRERLWNLELGLKADFSDVSLNASLFANRRSDQQVRTSVQLLPGDPASFIFLTQNAAEGRTIGAELESEWTVSDRVSLYASLGLLQAEFDSFDATGGSLDGRAQAHAPDYTAAAGINYSGDRGFFANLHVSAMDSFYFDVSHDQKSQAYQLASARLGYQRDNWRVTLWARNLFDESYAVRGFYFGNEPPDFAPELYVRLGDPRHLGISIDWSF